ncbi:hypothetical protein Tb10.6k15.2800 [Trypanosoma brucei brucei TREU927]|uniref:Uncharacterized protein n=1 Tax=Trypanosoma brucei brucei (strain 927/4 GUTat10.1) TaxID=185431 RepID=Q38AI7_TRYB2|nr:hypothetical protein Tb10.6k15.2800 [Trypanosoma brucei brucei TREU927]EAN78183.1 hypothetical protein Tb10.6k15.2800 [Trypanosoma brucei brucei TREU927]
MPYKSGVAPTKRDLVVVPPRGAGGFSYRVWEINSTPRPDASAAEDEPEISRKVQQRIHTMLQNWEQRTSQIILKWGEMGVKSPEHSRLVWRQAMEEKEMVKIQRGRDKLKAERQRKQRWSQKSGWSATKAWNRQGGAVTTGGTDNGREGKRVVGPHDSMRTPEAAPLASTSLYSSTSHRKSSEWRTTSVSRGTSVSLYSSIPKQSTLYTNDTEGTTRNSSDSSDYSSASD